MKGFNVVLLVLRCFVFICFFLMDICFKSFGDFKCGFVGLSGLVVFYASFAGFQYDSMTLCLFIFTVSYGLSCLHLDFATAVCLLLSCFPRLTVENL